MRTVKLLARLGQNKPGSTIQYTDTEADWLVTSGKAEYTDTTTSDTSSDTGQQTSQTETPDPDTTTLADLKTEAEKLGLPTSGTKAQLADRIQQHHERQQHGDD